MPCLIVEAGSHRLLDQKEAGKNQKSLCLKIEKATIAAILLSFDLMLLIAILNLNTSVRNASALIAFHGATH